MSKLCIGLIKKPFGIADCSLKEQISLLLNKYNLGVFFKLSYFEPFLKEYNTDECIIFSIVDNNSFDNCEMLFLPDNCYFNVKTNGLSFNERMAILKAACENILQYESKMEIFIGNSGAEFSEYEHISVDPINFEKILIESLNVFDVPSLHFSIHI